MTIFTDIVSWRRERDRQRGRGETLGVVPTMGALHDGHLSLVRRSRAENDRTLVTIFVNATQFDQQSDFDKYPRGLAADVALLEAEGVECVFAPGATEVYPDGYRYRVVETESSRVLEGVHRPGHFDGMLTVVLKLLNIADADRAYFGEKDWQQLVLVRDMAEALFLRTIIVGCPTVREESGLALSSRNLRLSAEQRLRAAELHRALALAPTPEDAAHTLRAAGFVVDYVEEWRGRRLAAVRVGDVRLIDNVPLEAGDAPDARRR